jgi:Uma2 family endonuclease
MASKAVFLYIVAVFSDKIERLAFIAARFFWEVYYRFNGIKRIMKGKTGKQDESSRFCSGAIEREIEMHRNPFRIIYLYISTMIVEEPAHKYYTSMSPSAFLEWERKAESRHEYASGTIISMAGASPAHNLILSNLITLSGTFLKGKSCNIYPSDLRIYVPSRESYFYPDASIICGTPDLSDEVKDTVKNPLVIFEILSPSTEDYDLGRKFFFYMQIETLKEYVTIDSVKFHIRIGKKQADGAWRFEEYFHADEQLTISSVGLSLSLGDIYEGVAFG